jgi:hypothetical protein
MNKVPRILDDAAREEAIIAALSRRRRADVQPALDLAARINKLRAAIIELQPDLQLPIFDTTGVEWALPAAYAAKVTEGEEVLAALQATFAQVQAERKVARAATMTPTERALEAKVEAMEAEIAKLKAGKASAAPVDARVVRGSRTPSTIEQMAGPGSRATQPTRGWFGASPDSGEVRLLNRGNAATSARPAMLVPGSPNRSALPGMFR